MSRAGQSLMGAVNQILEEWLVDRHSFEPAEFKDHLAPLYPALIAESPHLSLEASNAIAEKVVKRKKSDICRDGIGRTRGMFSEAEAALYAIWPEDGSQDMSRCRLVPTQNATIEDRRQHCEIKQRKVDEASRKMEKDWAKQEQLTAAANGDLSALVMDYLDVIEEEE